MLANTVRISNSNQMANAVPFASAPQMTYADQLYLEATKAIASGKKAAAVFQNFIQRGVHPQFAQSIVEKASKTKKAAFRQGGVKLLLTGLAMLVLGIIITGVSYSAAANGGIYFVAFGPVIFGVANMFRGLVRIITG